MNTSSPVCHAVRSAQHAHGQLIRDDVSEKSEAQGQPKARKASKSLQGATMTGLYRYACYDTVHTSGKPEGHG